MTDSRIVGKLSFPGNVARSILLPGALPIRFIDLGGATSTGELIREATEQGYTRIIEAQWRILTVHHFDGDKANDAWWNTLALCQRCHLAIQSRVDPDIPFFLEHSEWVKPYIAGFYAWKYEGRMITREEATERISELLAHEGKYQPAQQQLREFPKS